MIYCLGVAHKFYNVLNSLNYYTSIILYWIFVLMVKYMESDILLHNFTDYKPYDNKLELY
jgi:hypothetical protein